ncbi:Abi family protein [Chryseobacterium manosquense]|uniref:Abi family protein n=1 Tax=Chryseobacterium manosquense TaxID=2754694 RepID=A0A7H1DWT9_9FLAO|nr:Abi family protein [Chryseobacterium manosquense]QNS41447.1 Abi family protein [Chryseobacterium manosquense]ROI07308.1 Abi family protein [Kaistella haifensis]
MGNVATTVQAQLKLLKDRGLEIRNDEKAMEILLDVGYYRLGFYFYYFQDPLTHNFEEGICLDDIIDLYYFDFDIKMLLLRYIYRLEVHFRTQLVYYASNLYSSNNIWYADPKIVNNEILKEFNNIYYILKTNNNILAKHHIKYPHDAFAPAWKVFEFFTFGQTFKFYSNLKNEELKKKIAGVYGFRDVSLLNNYLLSIINIRNICSHNAVLYDFNQPIGIRRIPNLKYRFKTSNTTNLNASIRLLLYLLSKVSQNRAEDLERDLRAEFEKGKSKVLVNRIINNKIKFDL